MDRREAREILESMKLIDFRFATKSKATEALDLAIEALTEPKTIIGIDIPYGSDKGLATIFKSKDDKLILEKVKELISDWIPVNERLPEVGEDVLASVHEDYAEHAVVINRYEEQPSWSEEAIMWIEKAGEYTGLLPSEFWHPRNDSPYCEAIEMAIAALRAENKKSILYICDRKKCNEGECPNPECSHTTDPNHRRRGGGSPSIFVEDQDGNLWEKYQLEMQMKREKCCPTGQESADEWYREEFIGGQDE